MVRVERDVFIRRSREYVFAYVTVPANDALWNSTIVETVLTSDGPLGAGSTLRSTIRFVGQHTDSTFEVTDYEPDRKMCVRSTSGPIAFTGCRVVELAEGGHPRHLVDRGGGRLFQGGAFDDQQYPG